MRTKKIHVPIYEYDVFMYQIEDVEDADAITRVLKKFKIFDVIEEVTSNVTDEVEGGAITCFNPGEKTAVCVFYPESDATYYEMTLDHEKRHIVDHILEHCDVHDMEAAAYLSGWLTTKFKF